MPGPSERVMTQFGCAPQRRPSPPADNPFLERLFSAMCENIPVREGGNFVDQVRRWYEVLSFMADLEPRTNNECLLAADVSMKHEFMQSVLARGKTQASREQLQKSEEFQVCVLEFQTALGVYDQ